MHSEQHKPARRNKEGDPSLHLHVAIAHVFLYAQKQMSLLSRDTWLLKRTSEGDVPREIQNMLYKYRFLLLYHLLGLFLLLIYDNTVLCFFFYLRLKCMLTMMI